MTPVVEIVLSLVLVIGGVFGFVGSYGLIKLPDTLQRLHAPTKASTVGVGSVLIASMLYFLLVGGSLSFHELLITIFLFVTAPVSAQFIAAAHMQRHVRREELPEAANNAGWAGYDDDPGEAAPRDLTR